MTTMRIRPTAQFGSLWRAWRPRVLDGPPTVLEREDVGRAAGAGDVGGDLGGARLRLAWEPQVAEEVARLPGLAIGVVLPGRTVRVPLDDRVAERCEHPGAGRREQAADPVRLDPRVAAERCLHLAGRGDLPEARDDDGVVPERRPDRDLAEAVAELVAGREGVGEVAEEVVPVVADRLRRSDEVGQPPAGAKRLAEAVDQR